MSKRSYKYLAARQLYLFRLYRIKESFIPAIKCRFVFWDFMECSADCFYSFSFSICLIIFSLCISFRVLYRLASILLSYLRRRSSIFAFLKSFSTVWPIGWFGFVGSSSWWNTEGAIFSRWVKGFFVFRVLNVWV